jgi:SAM-dependent methyltransferase
MATATYVHEITYRKRDLAGWVHRNRLEAIARAFSRHVGPSVGSWADFGCSNGFIIEQIVAQKRHAFGRIVGFDHVPELLDHARGKQIPGAEFQSFDLNRVSPADEQFDLVTSFETLEHVGDVQNAIANIVDRVRVGGRILFAVPNETGWPGLTKLVARACIRRNAHDDFFAAGGRRRYVMSLLLHQRIDGFRRRGMSGYGPHLGFDYRTMEEHIDHEYLQPAILARLEKKFTPLGMNVLLAYEKRAPAANRP